MSYTLSDTLSKAGCTIVKSGVLDAVEGRLSVHGCLNRFIPRQHIKWILTDATCQAATTASHGRCGIHGVRIEDPAELEAKLAEALAHPGPVLVDAVVNRMELAMPPKITAEMAKGFTLYMLKAVMNGRGDEVVELARSNLLR